MNETIKRIKKLEPVPEEKELLFGEASDLISYAKQNTMVEALAMAFKYGFSAGREYEREK